MQNKKNATRTLSQEETYTGDLLCTGMARAMPTCTTCGGEGHYKSKCNNPCLAHQWESHIGMLQEFLAGAELNISNPNMLDLANDPMESSVDLELNSLLQQSEPFPHLELGGFSASAPPPPPAARGVTSFVPNDTLVGVQVAEWFNDGKLYYGRAKSFDIDLSWYQVRLSYLFPSPLHSVLH